MVSVTQNTRCLTLYKFTAKLSKRTTVLIYKKSYQESTPDKIITNDFVLNLFRRISLTRISNTFKYSRYPQKVLNISALLTYADIFL